MERLNKSWKEKNSSEFTPVLFVATTSIMDDVPSTIRTLFNHEIKLDLPNEKEKIMHLENLIKKCNLSRGISFQDILKKIGSFGYSEISSFMGRASIKSFHDCFRSLGTLSLLEKAGMVISKENIEESIKYVQSHQVSSISVPRIPSVKWEDVGGVEHIKREILDTIELPLRNPELFGDGLRKRSGILLFGPPGKYFISFMIFFILITF